VEFSLGSRAGPAEDTSHARGVVAVRSRQHARVVQLEQRRQGLERVERSFFDETRDNKNFEVIQCEEFHCPVL